MAFRMKKLTNEEMLVALCLSESRSLLREHLELEPELRDRVLGLIMASKINVHLSFVEYLLEQGYVRPSGKVFSGELFDRFLGKDPRYVNGFFRLLIKYDLFQVELEELYSENNAEVCPLSIILFNIVSNCEVPKEELKKFPKKLNQNFVMEGIVSPKVVELNFERKNWSYREVLMESDMVLACCFNHYDDCYRRIVG